MYIFRKACEHDSEGILALYKDQIGKEFCPWDDEYPGEEEIREDLENGGLFILTDEDGTLLSAISAEQNPEADANSFWNASWNPAVYFARLAVRIESQNQGIAREMICRTMEQYRNSQFKAVRFMANRDNLKALKSYAPLGFDKVGECFLYEQHFYCYEKEL